MIKRNVTPHVSLYRACPIMLALYLVLSLSGCAAINASLPAEEPAMHTVSEFSDDERVAYVEDDRWEGFNRRMYRFNYNFDRYIFLPAVKGYEFIAPSFVQTGVSNFFDNIYEVRTLYNSLLQLKGEKALTTLGRFVTNSTIGIGGLFNAASILGMKPQNENFGQTLRTWGVGTGPYLVLPILGPNTFRSAVGFGVDGGIRYAIESALDPFKNFDHPTAIEAGILALEATNARHKQKFRYYESGNPFEYYIVRFLYRQSHELLLIKEPTQP